MSCISCHCCASVVLQACDAAASFYCEVLLSLQTRLQYTSSVQQAAAHSQLNIYIGLGLVPDWDRRLSKRSLTYDVNTVASVCYTTEQAATICTLDASIWHTAVCFEHLETSLL